MAIHNALLAGQFYAGRPRKNEDGLHNCDPILVSQHLHLDGHRLHLLFGAPMAPSEGQINGETFKTKPPWAASSVAAAATTKQVAVAMNGDGQPNQSAPNASTDTKLSGKEAKLKAKAEKAARRAQDKKNQQAQSMADSSTNKQTESQPKSPRRDSNVASSSTQSQHKRTNSGQKHLPIRNIEAQAPYPPTDTKKGDKKVALFDHLYSHSRRTTLSGAAKDVHPAVLALGLQMSSYVICGSNARCVAMLLAFKQVRLAISRMQAIYSLSSGHSILRDSTSNITYTTSYNPHLLTD